MKLGHIPLAEHGASAIARFRDLGLEVEVTISIMADPKLADIPETVAGAAALYRGHGAALCTMHASMGKAAMRAVAQVCGDVMIPLAVTVLTSMSDEDCIEVYGAPPSIVVPRLVKLALEKGNAGGIICSPADLRTLREHVPDFDQRLFVTPGIRPVGADANDQARIETPRQAILNGATLLVIGRPITKATDPVAAAVVIVEEISNALEELIHHSP